MIRMLDYHPKVPHVCCSLLELGNGGHSSLGACQDSDRPSQDPSLCQENQPSHQACGPPHWREGNPPKEKRKEKKKTTPFGVNFMRSQVYTRLPRPPTQNVSCGFLDRSDLRYTFPRIHWFAKCLDHSSIVLVSCG
jgi:hypothetical protein